MRKRRKTGFYGKKCPFGYIDEWRSRMPEDVTD